MSGNIGYDISIWEEIRSAVKWKTDQLVGKLKREIPRDASLTEYHGKVPVPWQLREVMRQRGNAWVQNVYDLCCEARKDTTNAPSRDFDRAVWAFWIEPFIMGERRSTSHRYNMSPLLDLLFCAAGLPYEKRDLLTVSERDCCLDVRRTIYETWYDQLHHLPSRLSEAAAAMGRYNALEARAIQIAAGLPREAPPPPIPVSTPGQPATSEARVATAATWEAIEVSFLSDERLQIRKGGKLETLNYAEFGLADGRSGKPKEAWATLRALATQGGVMAGPTTTDLAWEGLEKRIQEIRKVFRKHFGLLTDPIPFVPREGYKARFKIACGPSFHT